MPPQLKTKQQAIRAYCPNIHTRYCESRHEITTDQLHLSISAHMSLNLEQYTITKSRLKNGQTQK